MSEPEVPRPEIPNQGPRNWLLDQLLVVERSTGPSTTRLWEDLPKEQREVITAVAHRAYPGDTERNRHERQTFVHNYLVITKLLPIYLEQSQEVRNLNTLFRLGETALDTPLPDNPIAEA